MKTDNGPRVLVVDDEPSIVDAVATSLRYEGFEVEEAMTGRAALSAAQERATRPHRPRRHAARPRRVGGHPAAAQRRDPGAGALPHRPRLPGGQDRGADGGRRRLRHQALRAGRDHRPGPGASCGGRASSTEDEGLLRFSDLEMDEGAHEVRRGGTLDPADGDRVQPAALLPAQSPSGALQGPDPRQRLALRLRRRRQRGGDLRELPAQEARTARAAAHPHHPPRRLHVARVRGAARCRCGSGCSSPSARWRSTALAIADVVTYQALRSFLYNQIDQSLRATPPATPRGETGPRQSVRCSSPTNGPNGERTAPGLPTSSGSAIVASSAIVAAAGTSGLECPAYVGDHPYRPQLPAQISGFSTQPDGSQVAYFTDRLHRPGRARPSGSAPRRSKVGTFNGTSWCRRRRSSTRPAPCTRSS